METKITKKTTVLLALLFVLASFGTYAQHNANDTLLIRKQRLDVLMKESSFIFEGKLISAKEFKGTNNKMYFSNIFEIQHVIVGKLQKGTVEIISEASYNKSDAVVVGRDKKTNPIFNGTSLYFCKEAETAASNSKVTVTNSKQLSVIDGTAFLENKITQHFPYSAFNYFTTLSQLYQFLTENYKINIDKSLLEKKSPVNTQTQKSPVPINPQEQKEAFSRLKAIQTQRHLNNQSTQHTVNCTDLFISEYIDGQGNNKSVEIYNPTNAPINLSNYSLLIYHGASYTPTTIVLTGTISAQSTHVVSKPNASSAILAHTNQTSNNLNFNGDEIIVLNKGTVHTDKIGIIGVAIGSGGWAIPPSGSTVNTDLRRKYNIGTGDTNWTNCKNEWDVLPKDSTNNLGKHKNICSTIPDPDLIYSILNPQTTGSSPQYFEFDVYVSSNNDSSYLEDASLHFTYNTTAFGTNISNNLKLNLTNIGTFANTLNYSAAIQTDHTTSEVTCALTANYNQSTFNLTQITTTPQPFIHVQIQIANCNVAANIIMTDFALDQQSSDFATSSLQSFSNIPTFYNLVDTLSGSGHLNNLTCAAAPTIQITDFPSPVLAGVGNTITIIGSGFGSTRGSGQVKFKNADDGGASYLTGLNANDYISSWTNTQIQIKLPSFVDTITTNSAFIIGGGNFIVTNNAGQSATSSTNSSGNPFDVYFSLAQVRNFSSPHNKDRINLRSTDTSGGYVLRLNPTDFPVGSLQRITFTKAVQDWRCLTGANINIGKDTIIASFVDTLNDGVNYIFFAPSSVFLGLTTRHPNTCNIDVASLTEADMQFTSTPNTFTYDTTASNNIPIGKYDFYEVALHELGHFIGLEHNNNLSNLMYYTPTTGNTSAQRKLLVVGTSPVDGGNYSVTHSMSSLSGGLCWPAMTTGSCSRPTGIEKYLTNNFFLNLYPNPTNGSIVYMDFQAPINTEAQVVVYDMMGRAVYTNNLNNRNEINNKYSLDVSNLSSGMYMVNLIIDKVKVCQKFVRQ